MGQRHHRFGSSLQSIEQRRLALEVSKIAVAKMTAKLRRPDEEPKDKPKRRPISDHIPRMDVGLTTGDDDCAQCGGALRRPGEDVTGELEYVPGRFIVNRIVRPRFACSGCEAFTQAALSSRPIERGRPCPGLPGHVLVNKYAGHLPLYRQSGIFEPQPFWNRWLMPFTVPAVHVYMHERGPPCSGRAGYLCRPHASEDVSTRHWKNCDSEAVGLSSR